MEVEKLVDRHWVKVSSCCGVSSIANGAGTKV